ncbi:Xaa-Pro aminopeptidase protein [Rhizobium etli bv. mimosae str. IE4771]|uniref:Xaa-Pro aminopeptidase protein n=1 Tax=Rhizobium etli bv. mimosae str. IE4771 TaxID=1432050 RepID=A0A060I393_RHIET|nr:aminopeptidase P family protein [Rhizobium sp. IE4771]AIC28179.1 Xaa-Pro aminopeptidase protein [Rhizobium sp. IE4771]
MFQSFDVTSTPHFGRERVSALRATFDSLGIDAFLVPRADEFNGEYVPACSERLAWLTGFTGSAGVALILRAQAIVFVDGRYVTQLAEQVDSTVFSGGDLVNEPPHVWLAANGAKGLKLGIDPWLHSGAEVRRLEKALAEIGGTLTFLPHNPLDRLWSDRPAEPLGAVTIQNVAQAGVLASDKIATIAASLSKKELAAVLIADPSSVAWIFNIRGADVPHTPHPLARAIILADGRAELFLDKRKTGIESEAYLGQICTQLPPSALEERLAAVSSDGGRVLIDTDIASFALVEIIRKAGGEAVEGIDPAKLPRAVKNDVEINGSAAAHLQDGAAMVEFLYWLSQEKPGTVSEIAAAERLEAARARVGQSMQNPLKDISFDTISGAGEHAAIMHYRVTTETDRMIEAGELFLIDSGAQYINGTTDITRTVGIGSVSEEHRRFFTLVLKGMIQISTARFPRGTRGCDLDPLARIALWRAGADFAHGTGHGVGSYLSVHEGPQRISRLSTQELLPGMILSNEPGYYRPGSFGIRIENLIYVRGAEEIEGGDMAMLGFETLTFCPIDRSLVIPELLTHDELHWFNDYHRRTREALMPLIHDHDVRAWLENATLPLEY